jgi:hypothetical protein
MIASNDLIPVQCRRVVTVLVEAPMEVENNVMGPGTKAAHLGRWVNIDETLARKADCCKGQVHEREDAENTTPSKGKVT